MNFSNKMCYVLATAMITILLGIITAIFLTQIKNKYTRIPDINNVLGRYAVDGTPRWTNPCNRTNVFTTLRELDISAPSIPISRQIEKIIEKLRTAQTSAENIQDDIAKQRIMNSNLVRFLQTQHFDGFPSTSMSNEELEQALKNFTETHKKAFKDISKVAVFMEAVRQDEIVWEHGAWLDQINNKEDKMYKLLCELDIAIHNSGGTIENHVERSIMENNIRTIEDRAYRQMRDYVVFKDSARLYGDLLTIYSNMLPLVNNSTS